jgi:uncharacterized protein (TIGR03382 family)
MLRLLPLCLALACLFAPRSAHANGDTPDASLVPDASVDQGGADMSSEENSGNLNTCGPAAPCDTGFTCENNTCVPSKTKQAGGCGGGATAGWGLSAMGLVLARRRRD